jgi:hypothetical protein
MSKVVFNNFYLVNKLMTNLLLKAGYIHIKVGNFAKVLEADLEHPDVQDAINKGWVEVHSSEPDVSGMPKNPVAIIEHDQYRGMTADELKDSEDAPRKSTATSETIGRTKDESEKTTAASVQIGQSAEEANGVAKRGRKATDKATETTTE